MTKTTPEKRQPEEHEKPEKHDGETSADVNPLFSTAVIRLTELQYAANSEL